MIEDRVLKRITMFVNNLVRIILDNVLAVLRTGGEEL